MAHGACIGSRPSGELDRPRWVHGSAAGLQVWSSTLDIAIWATLMVEATVRCGPIMLLNVAYAGTPIEGSAINWALALLAECEPGFYVLWAP